jgi:hypothetical protein
MGRVCSEVQFRLPSLFPSILLGPTFCICNATICHGKRPACRQHFSRTMSRPRLACIYAELLLVIDLMVDLDLLRLQAFMDPDHA